MTQQHSSPSIGTLIDALETAAWAQGVQSEREEHHIDLIDGALERRVAETKAARAALEAAWNLEPSENGKAARRLLREIISLWRDGERITADGFRYADSLLATIEAEVFAPSARPETVSDHGTNDPHLEGEVPLSERAARPEPGAGREP